ncbi:aspirochlorine biosynthesis cytochrome P450 monooxygenase [Microdochium nivale]|nr:aspirochlorine biosynthesis cytochrome P450 monooxygenase [Microdochium nivale]
MPLLESLIARGSDGDIVFLASAAAAAVFGCTLCLAAYRVWLHPLASLPGPKYMAISDIPDRWHAYISLDSSARAVALHRKYGPIVRIGPDRVMVAGSIAWPEVHGVRAGSGGAGEFGKVAGFLNPHDHQSLIGANYEDHRRQRRQLAHAFSAAALHEQEDVINQYIEKLMAEMSARAKQGEVIDIVNWFNYCTFDVIGDLCFAKSFQALEGNTTFVDNFFKGLIGSSYARFMEQVPLLKLPLKLMLGTRKVSDALKAGLANLALGRAKAQERIAQGEREDGRRDFSTYMLRKDKEGNRPLSDAEVGSLSSVLVVAGSETTATTLSGLVFFLCQPENADKLHILQEEVRTAFADDAEVDITATSHLEYLTACIEEALRMYPPTAYITPRASPGAEVGGHWLPRGTKIHVYMNATYRDPANFAEPDSFNPERWLKNSHPLYDTRFDGDRREVFKPFSTGPRDCIGKNLAYAEMRVITTRLVRGFNFQALPGQEDWMSSQRNTLLWLKSGFKIRPSLA